MATLNEALVIGDVVVREWDPTSSREALTILDGQTLVLGEVGGINTDSKVVDVATLKDDIYTITEQSGTDAGSFALRYRGKETAALAYNITNADLQTAVRALHADLDTAVAAGSTGGPYTITVPTEKKSDLYDISKGADDTNDGGTLEGGIIVNRTTVAEKPSLILLEASSTSGSDGEALCLVRNAVVDASNLTGSDSDIVKRLAESKQADNKENGAGYGLIIVRSGPTYTTLN